jgi:selenocysteine lyase/cysteine desulfurase
MANAPPPDILARMDWSDLRSQFPVTRGWAFLDHAGVSAASGPALDAHTACAADIATNGAACIGRWSARAGHVRDALARLIHGDTAGIAFVKNTTEAIGLVAEGIPWRPGDNVVLPADEYPSNQYPWMNLADRGVEVRRVPPRGNRVETADLRDAMNDQTRVLAVSYVGFASGFRVDLDALAELCRARDVRLCVDAIQGLGPLALDVSRTPVDFVTCGAHKWLLGYGGAGFLYLRPELIAALRPGGVGAHSVVDPFNYSKVDFTLKPDATRFEGGTHNLAGIAAWGASLELLQSIGSDVITQRIRELTNHLCEHAPRRGLTVFSSREQGDESGIVALDTPGRDPDAVARQCKAAGVAVNCRGGHLRVSPHCYNSTDDLDRFLDAASQP